MWRRSVWRQSAQWRGTRPDPTRPGAFRAEPPAAGEVRLLVILPPHHRRQSAASGSISPLCLRARSRCSSAGRSHKSAPCFLHPAGFHRLEEPHLPAPASKYSLSLSLSLSLSPSLLLSLFLPLIVSPTLYLPLSLSLHLLTSLSLSPTFCLPHSPPSSVPPLPLSSSVLTSFSLSYCLPHSLPSSFSLSTSLPLPPSFSPPSHRSWWCSRLRCAAASITDPTH